MNHLSNTQTMWQWLQQQQRQMHLMEKKLAALEQEVEELKKRPPVSVEKIEYSFDQLKVETLSGALHIGLTPSDLSGIKDLDIDLSKQNQPNPEQVERVLQAATQFIDSHLETIASDYALQMNRIIDPQMIQFMKQDLFKQLPQRIGFYLQQSKNAHPDAQFDIVFPKVKADIEQALFLFMSKMDGEMRGESNHEDPNHQP
ncbi:spore germination protein PC [Bacillus ectoiniformans]|uniref:spore germination protein GerPC n=1 Tax=Bacillus ectoiniformans TaxID=1494429 RepID=UPI00195B68E9|nr:spore germination protein GerPC [Bacillus ectoiniformans]MBM7647577.1 spore germination protein PC [Bacillus ectoiniformans]